MVQTFIESICKLDRNNLFFSAALLYRSLVELLVIVIGRGKKKQDSTITTWKDKGISAKLYMECQSCPPHQPTYATHLPPPPV
jgi:hypothetical protein